jgi:hypothetical protein
MTYIFLKHRGDGNYDLRIRALNTSDYRQMLTRLEAYIPSSSRKFDVETRTWNIQGEYKREIELWVAGVIEQLNPLYEFYCERHEAWESKVAESYRTLHLAPGAPQEVVKAVYHQLVKTYRLDGGDSDNRLDTLSDAYEFIMKHIGEK